MRISRKFILTAVLMILGALLLPASVVVADEEIVTFPDPNLDALIRQAINKPTGDIYQSDLDGLTDLSTGYGKGITDLTGMEHCTSLTSLILVMDPISDISPLSNLTSLEWLELHTNEISDISALSNLTSLWYLELQFNDISDISPLSNLTSLYFFWLHRNQIGNISILSNFTNLSNLDLSYNQIVDIEPLVSNPGLSDGDKVNLTGNPLNDVSIDSYIPQLRARGVEVYYDPSMTPGGGEGCFIATAAYGTSTAKELDTLRDFRDEVLLKSTVGSHLVEWYYQTSPPVADFISENSLLKAVVGELVINPIVWVVKSMEALW